MAFPSLDLIRGVVGRFVSQIVLAPKFAREDPQDDEGEESGGDLESHFDKAKSLVNEQGIDYDKAISRAFAALLQQAIDIPDDPSKSAFWSNSDVIDLLTGLPDKLLRWTTITFSRKFSRKLNRSLGSYVHRMLGTVDELGDRKVIAYFEGPDMDPSDAFSVFADLLKKETGRAHDPKKLAEFYKYEKSNKPVYDERDMKTNASVTATKALDTVISMLSDELIDPGNFGNKLAEQKVGKHPATTWIRPVAGKTQSAQEHASEYGARDIDPEIGKLMREAIKSKEPIAWNYVMAEVAPSRHGPLTMLTMSIPKFGGKNYTVVVPDDVGLALQAERPGEEFTLRVLDEDRKQGFQVSLGGLSEKVVLSARRAIRSTGVTAGQLKNAIVSMIDDYANKLIRPEAKEGVSAAAEEYFGRVVVDGRNIAKDQDFKDLLAMHGETITQTDPRGGLRGEKSKQQEEAEKTRAVLESFKQTAEEWEKILKEQAGAPKGEGGEGLGEDVVWLMHQRMDHANKAAAKISDKISRRFPETGRFWSHSQSWTYGNALKSRAGVKWLTELAMHEALLPTKSGRIHWESLVRGILQSDILGDAEKSIKFGGKSVEDILPALKVAWIGENKKASMEEKKAAYEAFKQGSLTVSAEERAAISKDLKESKTDVAIRDIVIGIKEEIQKAILEMLAGGRGEAPDPDIVAIVETTKARLPERMTKREKEEAGVALKGPKVMTTFKQRAQEAAAAIRKIRDQTAERALALEGMLEEGDYDGARSELKAAKVRKESLAALEDLAKSGPAPAEPDEERASAIEAISAGYERALNEAAYGKMEQIFQSVATAESQQEAEPEAFRPEGVVEEAELAEKQSSLNRLAVKLAMSRMAA